MANNNLGLQVARWLSGREAPVAVVVHPTQRARFSEEIVSACGLTPDRVFDGSTFQNPEECARLAALAPEIGVSILFDYVLRGETLGMFPRGCINLHPSLLPYNRGQYPNVWSIVEGTPSGVTLHYMDEGVDTGDIVAQREVPVSPTDTGESLYRKLEGAGLDLFRETWPAVERGTVPRAPQARDGGGTYHRTRDVNAIDRIELDRSYTARQLIDVLRARTFPPYRGAYFEENGRRVYMRLGLDPDDSAEKKGGPGA